MVNAEYLFLLTDVDGLYTENPSNPNAVRIDVVTDISSVRKQIVINGAGVLGTGGMETKLIAADLVYLINFRLLLRVFLR